MVHSVVPYCACTASRPLTNPCTQIWEGEMYSHDGQNLFVIDGHMHFWDANPENWRNKYGESWMSSIRTASILTPKTTSSRPSIRTAFCCVALSTRETKRLVSMPFAG